MGTVKFGLKVLGVKRSLGYIRSHIVRPRVKAQNVSETMSTLIYQLSSIVASSEVRSLVLIKPSSKDSAPYILFDEFGLHMKIECTKKSGIYIFNIAAF